MANYVYIATSIDGYIAGEGGNLDWLMEVPNPDDSDFGFADFMRGIDALIMGRVTYETAVGFDQWIYDKPVFVISNTLETIDPKLAGKAEIIRGSIAEILEALHERGFANLYIDGGKTIQSFLREDLIDEIVITLIPTVLGSGIPLFAPMEKRLKFNHVDTIVYENGLVKNIFRRERQE